MPGRPETLGASMRNIKDESKREDVPGLKEIMQDCRCMDVVM